MPVADPHAWAVLQFGDQNAWLDFLGQHALWHRALDVAVRALGGVAYPSLPLGDGGGDAWHEAHQQAHEGAAASLVIASPIDFRSYDLTDPEAFPTWTYLHAQEHIRLRGVVGI